MLRKVRKLVPTTRYALESFHDFSGATRESADLFFYREFLHFSPIPETPPDFLKKLWVHGMILPGKSLFEDGTQSIEGLYFLVSLAKALDARRVFEFGTFTGVTAYTLAMNLPQSTIHTLDLPAGGLPSLNVEKEDKGYIPSNSRTRAFDGTREATRIVQHEGDSAKFDFSGWKSFFDLVYIDGAHSYDYVASDTRHAFQMICESAGAIVWDDYGPGWPGVVEYLDGRKDLHLYRVPGTRLVFWLSDGAAARLIQN